MLELNLGTKLSFGFAPALWFHLGLFAIACAVVLRPRDGVFAVDAERPADAAPNSVLIAMSTRSMKLR